jgi:transposase-like protein
VSLAATALAHGVNANLLRKWVVRQMGRRRAVVPAAKLLAVTTLASAAAATTAAPAAGFAEGQLELIVAGGTIRIRGRIDAESLRTVLECLAARA